MSRLRSAPAAKRPATARAAGGRPGVFVQTPKSDIYVVMLSIALGAILLGSLLLALVMNRYEWSTTVASAPDAPSRVALAAISEIPDSVRL